MHVLIIESTALTQQVPNNLVRPHFYSESHDTMCYHTDPPIVAMRDLYMKTGQGFLLVFSISSASSLSELAGLRDEIIRIKDDDNVPIVICGNKADLEDQRTVPRTKGFSLSQRWGAPYYESSARTRSKHAIHSHGPTTPGHYPNFASIHFLFFCLPDLIFVGLIRKTANVDEVFVDLCRQMLRRDDAGETQQQDEPEFDPYSLSYYKKRRKQRREREKDPHRPKCVIL